MPGLQLLSLSGGHAVPAAGAATNPDPQLSRIPGFLPGENLPKTPDATRRPGESPRAPHSDVLGAGPCPTHSHAASVSRTAGGADSGAVAGWGRGDHRGLGRVDSVCCQGEVGYHYGPGSSVQERILELVFFLGSIQE